MADTDQLRLLCMAWEANASRITDPEKRQHALSAICGEMRAELTRLEELIGYDPEAHRERNGRSVRRLVHGMYFR